MVRSYKELRVWERSRRLVKLVYQITRGFPSDEQYGMVSQMRRSALSIPSNIAEGYVRSTKKEFRQFVAVARGSCAELETQTVIASDLNYLTSGEGETLLREIEVVAKMLSSLFGKL
ncbi:MAG: four helix bundle protein [Candidatus Kerfeldbacteria bacterium]|nr:four helix bundle protein [Candidatus Kerfeldbacteria bacterium]